MLLYEDFDFNTVIDDEDDIKTFSDIADWTWLSNEFKTQYLPMWKFRCGKNSWEYKGYLDVQHNNDGDYSIVYVYPEYDKRNSYIKGPITELAQIKIHGNNLDIILEPRSSIGGNYAFTLKASGNGVINYLIDMAIEMKRQGCMYQINSITSSNDEVNLIGAYYFNWAKKIDKNIVKLLPNIKTPRHLCQLYLSELCFINEEAIDAFCEWLGKLFSNISEGDIQLFLDHCMLPGDPLPGLGWGGRNKGTTAKIIRSYLKEYLPNIVKRRKRL